MDSDTVSVNDVMKNLPDALANNKLHEFIKSILNMKSSLFDLSKDSLTARDPRAVWSLVHLVLGPTGSGAWIPAYSDKSMDRK